MFRLVWPALGFCGGIIVGRNSEPMNNPAFSAILLAFIVACGVMWTAGYRGKNEAVATAVSVAVAKAEAKADAKAAAVANSAINLYLGSQAGVSPELTSSIVDRAVEAQHEQSFSSDFQHDASGQRVSRYAKD